MLKRRISCKLWHNNGDGQHNLQDINAYACDVQTYYYCYPFWETRLSRQSIWLFSRSIGLWSFIRNSLLWVSFFQMFLLMSTGCIFLSKCFTFERTEVIPRRTRGRCFHLGFREILLLLFMSSSKKKKSGEKEELPAVLFFSYLVLLVKVVHENILSFSLIWLHTFLFKGTTEDIPFSFRLHPSKWNLRLSCLSVSFWGNTKKSTSEGKLPATTKHENKVQSKCVLQTL